MAVRKVKLWTMGAAGLLACTALAPAAQAQDFFANFFRGFGGSRPPAFQMPFGGNFQQSEPRQRHGGGQAYCVRTCDGRYFPVTGSDNASRAASCNQLCPASDTKVYSGATIDDATAENGKSYSDLPTAFRYRNELVSGCTCNGKDSAGLAQVKIEDDTTLRKGDIVAGDKGLLVAGRSADRRGASVNFSPASEKIAARYSRPPVLARE